MLDGFVFDAMRFNQADEFIKTKDEIIEYVGKTFTNGRDIKKALKKGKKFDFEYPDDPKKYNASGDEDASGKPKDSVKFVWE